MTRLVFLAFLYFATVSPVAKAAIIVDIQDATISAGGSGFVDVLISSSLPVNLDFAAYDFEISLVGGPVSTLQFTDPQVTEVGLPDYVFAGNAAAIIPITLTNSRFVADAASQDFLGVGLGATPRLLVRLELESVLGPGHTPALVNGEQFRISLLDSGNTLFTDELGNHLAIDPSSFTNFGLVTIQDVTAVPEPSSLAICVMGAAAMGLRMRRRRSMDQVSAVKSLGL